MIRDWYTKRNSPELLSTDSLIKKLDDDDLKRLSDHGVKSHFSSSIKAKPSESSHPGFDSMVSSSDTQRRDIEHDNSGYEPKLVYHGPDSTYMVKPFHSHNGTGGIAVKAMNRMFNDAGMSDKVENVKVQNLVFNGESVPVTVHKFETGVVPAHDIDPSKVDGLDINKINVLDFLHGNYDRHDLNLLFKQVNGKPQPLAIDHSLGLDYHEKGMPNTSNMNNYHQIQLSRDPLRQKKLALWWKAHSNGIRSGFIDEMNAISHEPTRDNLLNHFKDRHSKMTEWSDKVLSGESPHFDDIESTHHNKNLLSDEPLLDPPSTLKRIVDNLSKPNTYTVGDIKDAVSYLVSSHIPYHDFMHAMDMLPHTAEGHVAKHELINNLIRGVSFKADHQIGDDKKKLRDILINDKAMPEGSKHVNPLMADKIRRFLGDKA